MYTNFENIHFMHNHELVEGVNITAYFFNLEVQTITEMQAECLYFRTKIAIK